MRCRKVRLLLSDLYNGELEADREATVSEHLKRCADCRRVKEQYVRAMETVGRAGLPELPEDFASRVHVRLVREAESLRRPSSGAETWAQGFKWKSALQKGLLVLSGAAAMWLVGLAVNVYSRRTVPERPAPHSGRSSSRAPAVKPTTGQKPEPVRPVARRPGGEIADVPMETVAVLTVTVHSHSRLEDVEFQVVLPDGVAFVGHKSRILEERVMTWHADLDAGENVVRIPIKAQRVGEWLLVARATKGPFKFVSEKVLRVTRT